MTAIAAFDAKLREKLIAQKTLCFSSRNLKYSTRNSKFSTRNSKLLTRTSILKIFEFRGSRIELSRSSFEGLSTYICPVLYSSHLATLFSLDNSHNMLACNGGIFRGPVLEFPHMLTATLFSHAPTPQSHLPLSSIFLCFHNPRWYMYM